MNLTGRPISQKPAQAVFHSLRKSARGQTCTMRLPCCNNDTETTVLAHIRQFGWAGTSQKPPDFLAFYACSACHDAFDGRSGDPWGWEDVLRALGETLMRHHKSGLLDFGGRK